MIRARNELPWATIKVRCHAAQTADVLHVIWQRARQRIFKAFPPGGATSYDLRQIKTCLLAPLLAGIIFV